MKKINQEEYEVLKGLDAKWKWIARDKNRCLYAFTGKPVKKYGPLLYWGTEGFLSFELFDEKHLFHFIQWEDSEPYNIDELIEEYEIENGMRYNFGKMKLVDIDTSKLATRNGYIYVKESEETEVKKSIEWLKEEVYKLFPSHDEIYNYPDDIIVLRTEMLNSVIDLIDQLDEPEVLSQEWIDSKSMSVLDTFNRHRLAVPVDKLQNLLVPKQGEPTHAQVQKYYVVKSEGLDGVHYYFAKFDDEMNGLFTLPNNKKGAYRFDDKEKAQAIANYTDNKVEELEE